MPPNEKGKELKRWQQNCCTTWTRTYKIRKI